MLNPIPNVRGSGYDVIKKLRFRERKFALFFKHELPPPDIQIGLAGRRVLNRFGRLELLVETTLVLT